MSRRQETERALKEALLRLLEHRSAEAISVRDIASEAGVNHGLIHHYFGSKDGLIRAVAAEISSDVYKSYSEYPSAATFFQLLRERPALATAVARLCLDGPKDLLEQAAPPEYHLDRAIERIQALAERLPFAREVDGYVLNGVLAAAMLGWFAFKPLLELGYRIPEDADDQLVKLLTLLDQLLDGSVASS
jgi:AcrR family transcriptional regulator